MDHVGAGELDSNTQVLLEELTGLSVPENVEKITVLLRKLRLEVTKSRSNQEIFANFVVATSFLENVAFNPELRIEHSSLQYLTLQVLANSVVNNETCQAIIWNRHGHQISQQAYTPPLDKCTNVLLMIMYNIFLRDSQLINEHGALQTSVRLWEAIKKTQSKENFEYLHFILEHFLVQNGRACVTCYQRLNTEERIVFLDYVVHYLRENSPNGELTTFLMQHFAKEFRLKSDCLLRETLKLSNELHPHEVHSLLEILASATGSDKYAQIYEKDQSLFINVSSLLRCLVAAGKQPDGGGLDKPMTKLEEVAPSSNAMDTDYELRASYELKTLLVRCTANLLYENQANKGYALDTQLMPTLLECTTMDARNPLMREWSILAIRNACINCPEAQSVIAGLTQQGNAPNDILSELNLDMGALRISDRQRTTTDRPTSG
ncbi:ataxin-10 [Drosophila tropicalis]|uniref:ataxin-10 n=1 Tax=Drosophila tropicalis TaxID=46794 RepID=UPI0035AB979E